MSDEISYNVMIKMTQISRISWLRLGIVIIVAIIGVRLFWIQVIQHDEYVAAAKAEHTRKFELVAERGQIYMLDRDKAVPAVMNEMVWTVFIDPSYVGNKEHVEEVLDDLLGDKMIVEWSEVWSDMTRQYIEVAKNLTFDEIEAVDEANLKGVGKKSTTRRRYPYGELASQVLGFVNAENVGYGVEGALNDELAGTNGLLKTVADVNDIPLTIGDDNVEIPAVDGKNIVLSLDENVQRATEKALASVIDGKRITYASAVVMDPNSGRIWAMANLPGYNPEEYWKVEDASIYRNLVLEDPYESASVCKTFTYAAAIEDGVIRPSDTYINTGSTKVDDRTINNARYSTSFGEITFQTALNASLNTGSVEVLRRMGDGNITREAREALYNAFYNWFGLGQRTGIELYEAAGTVISPAEVEGNAVRYANMTFGQGMNVTMMQVAAAFSSVINGGKYYAPSIVAGELNDSGEIKWNEATEPVRQTVSEETSATMRDMLVKVRQAGAAEKDLAGYRVGVKSGTAETYDENGNYTSDATIASFIGFGGADDGSLPAYVVMVRIGGDALLWGSTDAEPAFTAISNFMLEYLKIAPSK